MSNLKTMFKNMAEANGSQNGSHDMEISNGTSVPPKEPTAKKEKAKATIEKIYQKKSQLEHILLRPDTYIGSVEKVRENMWIYDFDQKKMIQKEIEYVPGLYKIFDEILVNAADNKQRDPKMDCIKIDITPENNTISIYNNGKGIPVVMHKDEKMFVPTMIFGHLLTSSNYNDEEAKVTGGRNGYGAKLCNIFSTKFIVETASKEYKQHFKQTWGNNMSKASEPKVKDFSGEDFTKVTFCPDLEKFKMTELDDDIVSLLSRRAFDVAASTKGVKVFLNGTKLPVKNFKDYVDLYVKDISEDSQYKVCYEADNQRWEIALTVSDTGFKQMSFVNSIATTKGGRHVEYIVDMITKQLLDILKKKNKGGINIKPFQVKNYMWLFVNCLIVNPTFDSQTKENMTLQVKSFGSKCNLSEKFIQQVTKCGIVEQVLSWAKFKAQNDLQKKNSGKKVGKLKGVPKLEDANEAGRKNALKCTLILTEGDSAKSLAVSGLGVIGRDYYGVFPLRGKVLNVREATHKQILENQEINNLIKILGLQYKKKYNTEEDMKTLRYGKLMIMTDQDQDGSHIKGLLINFIHHNWPELLRQNFLEEFITPIVKARKKDQELSFFSLPEFEEWRKNTPNAHTYDIKYYKGLGTSTSKEAKEYFTNITRHRIRFRYDGQKDDDNIVLAFSKKHVDHRKEWLTNFMEESRRRKELDLGEKYLYTKDKRVISYSDFINLELVHFSNADNVRSIPCLVDGFKPGQRKIMYTCFKRNDKKEVKVAQLAGSVAELSAYHHGEISLCMTIVNLAQNFLGSNNISLLEPRGQFGTRLQGGKDSASPRYIFTKMSPLTRMIFNPNDDPLLKHEYDDNQKIEPTWYIPIIPMLLVNGADGIGTGWMTKIPNYNPRDLVKYIRALINEEAPPVLQPWYKHFRGTIESCADNRYIVSGECATLGETKIEITELPVGTWTQNYKENVLELLLYGNEKQKPLISDYKEYHTDTTVKFVVTVTENQMEHLLAEGLHKVFKLQNFINLSQMCAFDDLGCLKRYDAVSTIMKEYFDLRVKYYQKRKDFMEGMLQSEVDRLSAQAKFILEKCSGQITVENKKRKVLIEELLKRGYKPDPVMVWKLKNLKEEDEKSAEQESENEEDAKDFNKSSDVKKFDYLLGMSMWMLTEERKNELLRQSDNKKSELEILKKKTKFDLWQEDLDQFLLKLDQVEAKELKDMATVKDDKKSGPKKRAHIETMPSPMAQRVAPKISDDMKKKIQAYSRALQKKGGAKKESQDLDVSDEFDMLVKNGKKTLKEKLGTPEEAEKKSAGKGKGLKQTKLNFTKSSKKKSANLDDSSTDEEWNSDFSSDDEKETDVIKTKPLKLDSSDSEDNIPLKKKESSEELFDSLIGKNSSQDTSKESVNKRYLSGSDNDEKCNKKYKENVLTEESENNDKPIVTETANNYENAFSDSDSDFDKFKENRLKKLSKNSDDDFDIFKEKKVKSTVKETKKPKNSKKKTQILDSDSDEPIVKKPAKKKQTKKNATNSDSDSDEPISKKVAKTTKKKATKKTKKINDSSEDSNEDIAEKNIIESKPSRNARTAATKSKYTFSDDDSDL